ALVGTALAGRRAKGFVLSTSLVRARRSRVGLGTGTRDCPRGSRGAPDWDAIHAWKGRRGARGSRALILDPLAGHAPARTHISDPDLRGTMKELAQLDGAFVISDAGIVLAACRYLDASVEQIELPLGFGSRHVAAASISQRLGAIAIAVSGGGGGRGFHRGQIQSTR